MVFTVLLSFIQGRVSGRLVFHFCYFSAIFFVSVYVCVCEHNQIHCTMHDDPLCSVDKKNRQDCFCFCIILKHMCTPAFRVFIVCLSAAHTEA